MDEVRIWAPVALSVVTLGGVIYGWITNPGKAAAAKAHGLAQDAVDRLGKLDERVARVESEIRHLPDADSVHRLELSIEQMRGEMRAMSERLAMVGEVSGRLQAWLLEQGK